MWFLFQNERVSKPCMTNSQSGYKTCSFLNFLDVVLHTSKVGWIWKILLWMLLLHCYCHFVLRKLLIAGFRSVYGILNLSGVRSKADLAAEWMNEDFKNRYFMNLWSHQPELLNELTGISTRVSDKFLSV